MIGSPNLKAEENRAFEAGFEQSFFDGKYSLTATYFNNQFRNQIDFRRLDPTTFVRPVRERQPIAGARRGGGIQGPADQSSCRSNGGYTYDSTQILERRLLSISFHAPRAQPLLRRPKHSGSLLLTLSRQPLGSESGRQFRRPTRRFRFPRLRHRPCGRLRARGPRRMVRDHLA